MRKMNQFLLLASALLIQPVFADDAMSSHSKACDAVAKACLHAGYSRKENSSKMFWASCMKPMLMGNAVKGVKLDNDTINTCRTDKIAALKQELSDLENVTPK